jgi:hypothetical protein
MASVDPASIHHQKAHSFDYGSAKFLDQVAGETGTTNPRTVKKSQLRVQSSGMQRCVAELSPKNGVERHQRIDGIAGWSPITAIPLEDIRPQEFPPVRIVRFGTQSLSSDNIR